MQTACKEKGIRKNVLSVMKAVMLTGGIYIALAAIIALCVFKTVLDEGSVVVFLSASGIFAAWCGGKLMKKLIPKGAGILSLLPAIVFGLVYIMVGIAAIGEETGLHSGLWIVLCAVVGGTLSVVEKRRAKRKGMRIKK